MNHDDMDLECMFSGHDSPNTYDRFTCSPSMGIPTSGDGILLRRCLIVCRFSIDVLLVFDTHILQSISVVTSSNFILWGEFCYTLFWSPQ
jgi:hypothetical protein